MNKVFAGLVFIGVSVSVVGSPMHGSSVMLFVFYSVSIISLAAVMGWATEGLAVVTGTRLGRLCKVTSGIAQENIVPLCPFNDG